MLSTFKNPYNYKSVLSNPNMFFGRAYEIEQLHLNIYNHQSTAVMGPKYIGKSSLLQYVCSPTLLEKSEYDWSNHIFTSIEIKKHLITSQNDFFNNVNRQIILQSGEKIEQTPLTNEEPEDVFLQIINQINKQGFHMVLLLDDFDYIMRNPQFDFEFFSFLRSQATAISYITASIAPLHEISHEAISGSPFFNIFGSYYLGPLSMEDALDLIILPPNIIGSPFSNVEIEWILKHAGRHPFLIQCTCYFSLNEKYNKQNLSNPLPTLEKRVYDEIFPYFKHAYESSNSHTKIQLLKEVCFVDAQNRKRPELSESLLFCHFMSEEHGKDVEDTLDNIYGWKFLHEELKRHLLVEGNVDPSTFPGVPVSYVDKALKRYIREHSSADLYYSAIAHSLHLKTASQVQRVENLLKPIVHRASTASENLSDFTRSVEQLLQEISSSIGLGEITQRETENISVFLFDTRTAFTRLRFLNPLLVLATPAHTISDLILEHIRYLLVSKFKVPVAIFLLFMDTKSLAHAKLNITKILREVYALNIAVVSQSDLLEIVAAREPTKVLRRLVLSQVNLTLVSSYTITGPTPSNVFFGREREIYEISHLINKVSYILIGGRRIGKTSIMQCLHTTRLLAADFRTVYHDCSVTSSYEAFLSAKAVINDETLAASGQMITFDHLLTSVQNDKKLILLLDEADKLIPSERKNGWPLFNMLRSLINSGRIQVVLSGEHTLREALNDSFSPLYNFGTELLIGRLDKPAVTELITLPMKELEIELVKEKAIVECIWEFSSGHPNVVQRLCHRLIDTLSREGRRRVTLKDVKELVQDPKFQKVDFLNTYWAHTTLLERAISLTMIRAAQQFYTPRDVRQLLNEYYGLIGPDRQRPSSIQVDAALGRLTDLRCILQYTYEGYSFAVEAFPKILTRPDTMDDLSDLYKEAYLKYGDLTWEEITSRELVNE